MPMPSVTMVTPSSFNVYAEANAASSAFQLGMLGEPSVSISTTRVRLRLLYRSKTV